MAYSDFTLDLLEQRFGLTIQDRDGIFDSIPPVPVSDLFRQILKRNLPLVEGIGTEKVRSEMIIAPLLVELREHLNHSVAVFSGAEFTVNSQLGLTGFCDYLISQSSTLLRIAAPVVTIVEAKREDLTGGIPQCIAEMYAAQQFNEQRSAPHPFVYGVVTSGTAWKFLRLYEQTAEVDLTDHYISDLERIFGILVYMATRV
jgi:hypothetical protein